MEIGPLHEQDVQHANRIQRAKDACDAFQRDVDARLAGNEEVSRSEKQTKADLQEQLRLFRDQLNEADSKRDRIRQNQLRKQIWETAERIVKGDYVKQRLGSEAARKGAAKMRAGRTWRVTACIVCASAIAWGAWYVLTPHTYQDCILAHVGRGESTLAARYIAHACAMKFPKKPR